MHFSLATAVELKLLSMTSFVCPNIEFVGSISIGECFCISNFLKKMAHLWVSEIIIISSLTVLTQ